MKFNLKRFRDLGKCSYATLKEEFDTEKDVIYLEEKPVQINNIEDLFPFLWRCPGIAFRERDSGKSAAHFWGKNDAWYKDYFGAFHDKEKGQKMIAEHEAERAEIEQKLREDNAKV